MCIYILYTVHVYCILYMYIVYCTYILYTVHIYCIQYMYIVYSTCILYTVHVYCILYIYIVYSTCILYIVHVYCIQYMYIVYCRPMCGYWTNISNCNNYFILFSWSSSSFCLTLAACFCNPWDHKPSVFWGGEDLGDKPPYSPLRFLPV